MEITIYDECIKVKIDNETFYSTTSDLLDLLLTAYYAGYKRKDCKLINLTRKSH